MWAYSCDIKHPFFTKNSFFYFLAQFIVIQGLNLNTKLTFCCFHMQHRYPELTEIFIRRKQLPYKEVPYKGLEGIKKNRLKQ